MISREEALTLLHKYLNDDKLRKHSYAVEAIMKETAIYLNKDKNLWALVGLLHDIDYEYTENNPNEHGKISAQILDNLLSQHAINAIKGHNYIHTGYLPTTYLDKALIASDAISGLIIATTLVMPNKRLSEVKQSTVKKKIKDTSFAKNVNRRRIQLCQDLGIDIDLFIKISISAMKKIHKNLQL